MSGKDECGWAVNQAGGAWTALLCQRTRLGAPLLITSDKFDHIGTKKLTAINV